MELHFLDFSLVTDLCKIADYPLLATKLALHGQIVSHCMDIVWIFSVLSVFPRAATKRFKQSGVVTNIFKQTKIAFWELVSAPLLVGRQLFTEASRSSLYSPCVNNG